MPRFSNKRKQSLGSSQGNQLSHNRSILGTPFKEERPLGAKCFPEVTPPPPTSHTQPRPRRRARAARTSLARPKPRPPVVRKTWPSPARFSRRDRPIADATRAKNARKKLSGNFFAIFADFLTRHGAVESILDSKLNRPGFDSKHLRRKIQRKFDIDVDVNRPRCSLESGQQISNNVDRTH